MIVEKRWIRNRQIKTWLTKWVRKLIPEVRRCVAKRTTGNFTSILALPLSVIQPHKMYSQRWIVCWRSRLMLAVAWLAAFRRLHILIDVARLKVVVDLSERRSAGWSVRPATQHQAVHVSRADLGLLQATVSLYQLKHLQPSHHDRSRTLTDNRKLAFGHPHCSGSADMSWKKLVFFLKSFKGLLGFSVQRKWDTTDF